MAASKSCWESWWYLLLLVEEVTVVVGVVAVGVEEALVGVVDLLPVGVVPNEEEDEGEESEADAEGYQKCCHGGLI